MNGIPVARLFGIEIRVHLGWVIVLGLIGYIAVAELQSAERTLDTTLAVILGGVVAIGFFASSLIHELAHALVAQRRGLVVPWLAVSFFGGSTPLDPIAAKAADELAIAVAGPLSSIALGVALIALAAAANAGSGTEIATLAATLGALSVLNFILGFVNLLPAYPLDGGRIIRAIGWSRGGTLNAGWRAAGRSGRLTGYAGIGFGIVVIAAGEFTSGAMIALSGWFLALSARSIVERLRVDALIGGLHVEDAMETGSISIGPGLTVDTFASQLLDEESTMTAVPVVSDDTVVGVLGVREVRRLRKDRWSTTRVEEVMAKPPRLGILSARDNLVSAVERLQRAGVDGLPVVDGGSLVGMLTRRSVGKLIHDRGLLTREGRAAG
jgi:Zn-dependent protease/CBS domain-containing protein